MRSVLSVAFVLALLSGCAAEGGSQRDRGKPVIETYQAPLTRDDVPDTSLSAGEDGAPRGAEGAIVPRLESLKPGERPPQVGDEAGLWMQSDAWEEALRGSARVVEDPELIGYVRNLACKVAGARCDDVRVYVVERPGFNARMAPNGAMEIWTGALLRLRSEAELAALIGHEVGHFLRRHSVRRLRSTRIKIADFLKGHAGTVTARAGYFDLVGSLAGYSRESEREADGYGLRMLVEAGYDPTAVAELWARASAEFEAVEAYRNQSAFYASHPLMKERAEVLARLAKEERAKMDAEPVLGRDAYLSLMQPRRAAFLRQELNQRAFEQVEALLQGLLRDDDPNPAELHYFLGELYRLRDDAGDAQRALNSFEAAAQGPGAPPPELHRSRGLLLRRMAQAPAAADAFAAYLASVPNAPDRMLVEELIAALGAK